jgi:hypothetical protein
MSNLIWNLFSLATVAFVLWATYKHPETILEEDEGPTVLWAMRGIGALSFIYIAAEVLS